MSVSQIECSATQLRVPRRFEESMNGSGLVLLRGHSEHLKKPYEVLNWPGRMKDFSLWQPIVALLADPDVTDAQVKQRLYASKTEDPHDPSTWSIETILRESQVFGGLTSNEKLEDKTAFTPLEHILKVFDSLDTDELEVGDLRPLLRVFIFFHDLGKVVDPGSEYHQQASALVADSFFNFFEKTGQFSQRFREDVLFLCANHHFFGDVGKYISRRVRNRLQGRGEQQKAWAAQANQTALPEWQIPLPAAGSPAACGGDSLSQEYYFADGYSREPIFNPELTQDSELTTKFFKNRLQNKDFFVELHKRGLFEVLHIFTVLDILGGQEKYQKYLIQNYYFFLALKQKFELETADSLLARFLCTQQFLRQDRQDKRQSTNPHQLATSQSAQPA